MEYRKQVELDPGSDYWFVELGESTFLNGGSAYPFPSERAAQVFAENQKFLAKMRGNDREVRIRYPNGDIKNID